MTLDQVKKLTEIRATLEIMLVDLEEITTTIEELIND